METRLELHPDDDFVFHCLDGLRYGVSYDTNDDLNRLQPKLCHSNRRVDWAVLQPMLAKDQDLNYLSQPFPVDEGLPLFNVLAAPVFVNFKKISGKPRKINNLKGPGRANEYQTYEHDREWFGFKHAKRLLQFFGPGTLLRKDVIVSAYKIPPLKPQDWCVAAEIHRFPNHSEDSILLNLRTIFGGTNSFKMFDEALGAPLHFCMDRAIRETFLQHHLSPLPL